MKINKKSIIRWIILYIIAPLFKAIGYGNRRRKSVIYVGQAYYNNWYLSRALRKLGWRADVLNWDLNIKSKIFYHGEDFKIDYKGSEDIKSYWRFYLWSLREYDLFHFANKGGMQFGEPFRHEIARLTGMEGFEIKFLKTLGKKIVYGNNGCLDGVSQTSFSKWGPTSVCDTCQWKNVPSVCSDEGNLRWGKFRNEMADYQCLLGGNRADYNIDPTVHEVPEYYCLDQDFWLPDLDIPSRFRYSADHDTVLLYHAVGNYSERTNKNSVNVKSTHIYVPLIQKIRDMGHKVEMVFCTDVPNKDVRFYQAQADIFLEMLTYGWFGANAREAMMLGKPVICFLRQEWLDSAREEIPEYIDELPIVNATPETIEEILLDLIRDKEKRERIGRASREFAIKWHSSNAAAEKFNKIYSQLLGIADER